VGRFKRTHVSPLVPLARDEVPRSLRLKLWTIVREVLLNQYIHDVLHGGGWSTQFMNGLCTDVLGVDAGAWHGQDADSFAEWFIDGATWDSVYDVIDYIVSREDHRGNLLPDGFGVNAVENQFNRVLGAELSPWSFVNGELVYVDDVASVEAIADASATSPDLVKLHLQGAIDALSARPTAKVRTAIDEAVNAFESMTKHVLGNQSGTYGGLKQALVKKGAHDDFVEGFARLYKFASDAQGIRHGFKPGEDPDALSIAEARLFVIICSEYIRYLSEFLKP
jgi:hypothetical protein